MARPRAEAAPAALSRGIAWPLLALVVSLAAVLRLVKLPETSLGYDGLQSVTHAVRGFPVNALSAFLHDPHPPLYYVLLGEWMRLGTSDAIVLLLSSLCSLLLVVSVWWIARSHYGERAALVAALVCALHPLALYWSHFARMYALVMLLAVWAWHANLRFVAHRPPRWRDGIGVLLAELALVYSHVAGAFFAGVVALHPAWRARGDPGLLARWVLLQAVVALASLPALALALRTGAGHMQRPDLAELLRTLALFTLGTEATGPVGVAAGAAALALVAATLLARRSSRAYAVVFLVLPFALAAAVSHGLEPIWFGPRLFAFLTPFVAIGIGRLAGEPGPLPRLSGAVAALALLAVLIGAGRYTRDFEKPEPFADRVERLRAAARPGDLVLVPGLKDKWAVVWYLEGPDWSRGAWPEGGLAALRSGLDAEGRRALVARIAGYGQRPGSETPPVLPAAHDRGEGLGDAKRVWLLARDPAQRDELAARYEVGAPVADLGAPGIALSLHPRP